MAVVDQAESPQICNMSQLYVPLYILWTRNTSSVNGCQVLKQQEESLPFIY